MIVLALTMLLGNSGIAEGVTSSLGTQVILLIIAELLMLVIMANRNNKK